MAQAPIVKWYWNHTPSSEATEWNAGVVDANNYSITGAPSTSENATWPSTFLIWNNKGGSIAAADMTPVYVTTLSLTLDTNGNAIPQYSGLSDYGPVGLHNGATCHVEVAFHNVNTDTWGYYDDTAGAWVSGAWMAIGGTTKAKVVSASGVVGTLSGATNAGSLVENRANYSKAKFRLFVGSMADAGKITWLTRCSYQYTE